MLKLFFTSSENHANFGVSKVVNTLNFEIKKKKIISIYSNNITKFLFFKPDIIHINGCWKIRLIFFFIIAKILGVKIIISPHGMIDPFSLKQKKFKKNIALFLYQKFIFENSDLIIVNSKIEKKNFLKITKNIPRIIIIPHGVYLKKKFKIIENKKKELDFVFFSRIHPSKNLISLVQIWRKNKFFNNYNLDIFGEIDDVNYYEKFIDKIKNCENINYKGRINSKNFNYRLSKYDIFLHPSTSENFGLVILEAMSCGLFPIVNKKLDWKNLGKNNLGINLSFDYKSLKKAILSLNKSKKKIRNKKFKKKLRNYLLKNYNWKFIIKEYYKQYTRLIDL